MSPPLVRRGALEIHGRACHGYRTVMEVFCIKSAGVRAHLLPGAIAALGRARSTGEEDPEVDFEVDFLQRIP